MTGFKPTKYSLFSVKTGNRVEETGWTLDPVNEQFPSLVRADYEMKQIQVKGPEHGLYRFADWLPISRTLIGSSSPVTYKSEKLAHKLGLSNLWITFSGYWPEIGAGMKTCSFKETEAYSVCARLKPDTDKVLVVASAGNTARSFAKVCSENKIPLLLCIPQDNLDALWFEEPIDPCVKLIASRSGADYFDAIHLSMLACKMNIFLPEGGAKNIARRDGMGTTTLSAITTIGQIPGYYFQAVGSGTGAIAAWEANLRLIGDGRFGNRKMKLMVSQNLPFKPIYDAWKADSREMLPLDDQLARKQVEEIDAKVLSNRKPPYPIYGGLYDALKETDGDVLLATNQEAREAAQMFLELEGIDIHPAASVATASLIKEVMNGNIDKNEIIMLNITGGGENRFKQGKELFYLKPNLVFNIDPDYEVFREKMMKLF